MRTRFLPPLLIMYFLILTFSLRSQSASDEWKTAAGLNSLKNQVGSLQAGFQQGPNQTLHNLDWKAKTGAYSGPGGDFKRNADLNHARMQINDARAQQEAEQEQLNRLARIQRMQKRQAINSFVHEHAASSSRAEQSDPDPAPIGAHEHYITDKQINEAEELREANTNLKYQVKDYWSNEVKRFNKMSLPDRTKIVSDAGGMPLAFYLYMTPLQRRTVQQFNLPAKK
jgi:hypothetical protein